MYASTEPPGRASPVQLCGEWLKKNHTGDVVIPVFHNILMSLCQGTPNTAFIDMFSSQVHQYMLYTDYSHCTQKERCTKHFALSCLVCLARIVAEITS